MNKYIEQDAAIKSITSAFDEVLSVGEAIDTLDAIPAADVVEVRHEHWIKTTKVHPDLLNDSTYNYRCSNCGYMDTHGANVEVPYCWHCGAKMDGGADDSVD